VAAHWVKAKVGQHGELVLDDLPFSPGEAVEVLVVSSSVQPEGNQDRSLRNSVVE
jgi:hypothetical protein